MDASSPLTALPVLLLGTILLVIVIGITWAGMRIRMKAAGRARAAAGRAEDVDEEEDANGAIVSAVLGLLALLLGFTFALAVNRFETRRALVLEEANAIGTAYLQTQVLPQPHRERLSMLLISYTDNRVVLAQQETPESRRQRLADNDRIVNDIWAATLAGFDSIKHLDMSNALVSSVNAVIDMDTSRKAGRMTHVPEEVFWVLIVYVLVAAAIIGYIVRSRSNFHLACVMHVLIVMSLMLIIDIDRPAAGGIRESQYPMELLSASMHAQPRAAYDRWRTPVAPPPME
ncbi:bestrophin-like domain [Sphingobium naphthae]|uniref:DUF4239 domain-containing protein n=1 Tax=Sphingobium naphthae TaxID=1886786 RepID=A0ABU3ZS96_9SPHN|nr:hypothetical protein [Sphingobium naphthae]MDV5822390.1 hypothetical protein [Sphingobium naphthae]